MSFSRDPSKSLSAEINVTPLIDVLLVLLIIFMVIVPNAPIGLGASIPTPSDGTSSLPPEAPVLVEIRSNAANPVYRVDGISVDEAALSSHLRGVMLTRSNRQMLVQAEPDLDFGTVANIVDRGHAVGAETVGLLTLRPGH